MNQFSALLYLQKLLPCGGSVEERLTDRFISPQFSHRTKETWLGIMNSNNATGDSNLRHGLCEADVAKGDWRSHTNRIDGIAEPKMNVMRMR